MFSSKAKENDDLIRNEENTQTHTHAIGHWAQMFDPFNKATAK